MLEVEIQRFASGFSRNRSGNEYYSKTFPAVSIKTWGLFGNL